MSHSVNGFNPPDKHKKGSLSLKKCNVGYHFPPGNILTSMGPLIKYLKDFPPSPSVSKSIKKGG